MNTLSILVLILVAAMVVVIGILDFRADRDMEQRRIDAMSDRLDKESRFGR